MIFYKISYQELEAWPENFHHNWINNVLYIYIIHNVSLWINQHALPVVSRSIISKMWTNLKVSSTHPTLKLTQASLPPNPPKDKVNQLEKYSLVTCEIDSAFGYHLFPLFIVKNDILLRSLPLFTIHKRHINPNCYLKFAFVVFLHIIVLYI